MARVYLDANALIDFIDDRREVSQDILGSDLFISPLSFHIAIYVLKYKIPNDKLVESRKYFNLVPFDSEIVENALLGPTGDFEDNVQLHSAAQADCDYFLTSDKNLLAMKFFGKIKVFKDLPS